MFGTMAGKTYHVVVEKDVTGWLVGSVPELPGCHTQGKTQDELMANVREAIELYLEVKGSEEPHPTFMAVQTIEM